MFTILIADDEERIRRLVSDFLRRDGYTVLQAADGGQAMELIDQKLGSIDLIILDVMMPVYDGWSVLRHIRSKNTEVPVMMLTARTEENDEVFGFDLGADDNITKPLEIKEVVARVAVQLRHAVADVPSKSGQAGENQTKAENETGQGDTANTYIAGPAKIEHRQLVLDRISRQLYVADDAVDGITKQEFAILELLMAHPRQVFAKEDIFEYAWDEPYIGETKTLDVHISNIRKKIKKLTDDEYIETVWGIGYKMKE